MVRKVVLVVGILTFISTLQALSQSFQGSFEFRWTTDPQNQHRIMMLLSDASFTDKVGKIWSVPKGTNIDRASIPAPLWSFAGSPFVGNYRRASVIHDRFCDTKTERASDVHKMFREAMEADGVGYLERLSKYMAVSAYSVVTGACGKEEDTLRKLFSSNDFQGVLKSDELFKQLDTYKVDMRKLDTVASRADTIKSIAKIENPLTFAALTEFRRIPSNQNYATLETAIKAEQPTEAEADQLVLLANATVPEGSISLPGQ
ncbi:DUF1353 domain-containing protein [Mesorhizobium sp. M6A.T.Cr.TU.017.01.1.1]|uniref:DUF1353 domain-containing protein n=1 Tax=Mesorhizobium sp. M6A.T.Cr.TU.017.01.1.1 TaxID=2496774 RepID=UPI000FD1C40C|nr:DUF1353 domain-containing protein [Mesorhizobium sp. M6A.T.Cr.TU.017.01.1.1]RUU98423.1 DUF1353 domain-containing protein [Mesorhizobium sp. M6A.T.Cr.TU.017.01.1.1]